MIVPIVEGHSERESIPILLRRYIGASVCPIAKPIRIKRNLVVKDGELEKAVQLAGLLYPDSKAVIIILDTDDDCPAQLGPTLLQRSINAAYGRFRCAVVLPKTEFEAWFIASVTSLRGRRGISPNATPPPNPESIRDAKGWLSGQMSDKTYVEVDDQPSFAQAFDLSLALSSCRSFQKFDKEVKAILSLLSQAPPN